MRASTVPRGIPSRWTSMSAFSQQRSTGGLIPDVLGLGESVEHFIHGQQHGRLDRIGCTAAHDGQDNGGHGNVVRGVPDDVPVVIAEGVPKPMERATYGPDVSLCGPPAILRLRDEPGPGFRRIAEFCQVERHALSPFPSPMNGNRGNTLPPAALSHRNKPSARSESVSVMMNTMAIHAVSPVRKPAACIAAQRTPSHALRCAARGSSTVSLVAANDRTVRAP